MTVSIPCFKEEIFSIKLNDSENNQNLSNELYSKPPNKNYITNKTDVRHIVDTWTLDILYSHDNSPEN